MVLQAQGRDHHGGPGGRCAAEGAAERGCYGLTTAPQFHFALEPLRVGEQSEVKG